MDNPDDPSGNTVLVEDDSGQPILMTREVADSLFSQQAEEALRPVTTEEPTMFAQSTPEQTEDPLIGELEGLSADLDRLSGSVEEELVPAQPSQQESEERSFGESFQLEFGETADPGTEPMVEGPDEEAIARAQEEEEEREGRSVVEEAREEGQEVREQFYRSNVPQYRRDLASTEGGAIRPSGSVVISRPTGGPSTRQAMSRIEDSLSVTNPISPETQRLLSASGEALKRAMREMAMSQAAGDLASAEVIDEAVEDASDYVGDLAREFNENQQRYEEQLLGVQQLLDAVQSQRVDPNRFFHNQGAASAFGAALAVAGGAMAQAILGGPNTALDIIEGAIERDIQAQIANMQNAQSALGAGVTLLDRLRQAHNDEEAAIQTLRALRYQEAENRINAITRRSRARHTVAETEALIAQLEQRRAQAIAENEQIVRRTIERTMNVPTADVEQMTQNLLEAIRGTDEQGARQQPERPQEARGAEQPGEERQPPSNVREAAVDIGEGLDEAVQRLREEGVIPETEPPVPRARRRRRRRQVRGREPELRGHWEENFPLPGGGVGRVYLPPGISREEAISQDMPMAPRPLNESEWIVLDPSRHEFEPASRQLRESVTENMPITQRLPGGASLTVRNRNWADFASSAESRRFSLDALSATTTIIDIFEDISQLRREIGAYIDGPDDLRKARIIQGMIEGLEPAEASQRTAGVLSPGEIEQIRDVAQIPMEASAVDPLWENDLERTRARLITSLRFVRNKGAVLGIEFNHPWIGLSPITGLPEEGPGPSRPEQPEEEPDEPDQGSSRDRPTESGRQQDDPVRGSPIGG